jgi:type I restriction enzyme S subunit
MSSPKIRFKGFTDAWEQRKFGELLKETRNKTVVEDEDTLLSCAIDGMYLNSELFSHFRGSSNIGYLKIKKNDLILSAQNLHLGNCNVNLRFEHGMISPAYKVYELIECNPLFMQAWVKRDITKDFFLRASTEGASVCRKNIVWDELYEQELIVPMLPEQEEIGKYFDSLNHLITLHQRKCEETKTLKKYMLQKMFPQDGETIPEIRFAGFSDAWEQRKLGDVAEGFDYGLNVASTDFDGENKYLRITDIDDETRLFIQEYVTSPDIDLETAANYILHEGDILFARTGASVGKSYIYRDSDGLVYYAGFLIKAHVNNENNADFVFQNTLTESYNKYIQVTSQRSGQPGVNAKEYQEFSFWVPKKEEQDKISAYLRHLDHLITLHQRKCEELQNIKKFMLQNMFV